MASDLTWHVQELGAPEAPVLLLLHGTGAATHSWAGLAPLLAAHFRVVALDLPGHGFTDPLPPGRLSLPGMASARSAISSRLWPWSRRSWSGIPRAPRSSHASALDGARPQLLVALNGALTPFPGLASVLFPGLARMLFLNPVTPRIFAWTADRPAVERLIRGTGSRLDSRALDLYRRLFRYPGHVAGALGMMANWDLAALDRDIDRLTVPTLLLVGGDDRAIAPETAFALKERLTDARVRLLRNLGHLAHEEAPDRVAEVILRAAGTALTERYETS